MSRHQAGEDVYTAIADPTRRAILQQLGSGEASVTTLSESFAVTLSAVSQHIRVLREVGLVTVRKAGRERVYALNPVPLQTVAEWLRFYEPFWNDKLAALGTYLDDTARSEANGDIVNTKDEHAVVLTTPPPTQKEETAAAKRGKPLHKEKS